jgi:hypothetical protein
MTGRSGKALKPQGSNIVARALSVRPEREEFMRYQTILLIGVGTIALAACSKQEEVASAPPPPPGAVAGSTAADRDGDGIVDGYYTADGMYHPYAAPVMSPPPAPTRAGEKG